MGLPLKCASPSIRSDSQYVLYHYTTQKCEVNRTPGGGRGDACHAGIAYKFTSALSYATQVMSLDYRNHMNLRLSCLANPASETMSLDSRTIVWTLATIPKRGLGVPAWCPNTIS